MQYKQGNLLDVKEGIILHGCNAQGVMGSGVALAFKQRFPSAYQQYLADYRRGWLELGYISLYPETESLVLASGITQEFYGRDKNVQYVDYNAIGTILLKLQELFPGWCVHIPKIGAGYGNGDWNIIEQIIDSAHGRVTCWTL